jgi:hypothetical protein
MATLIDYPDDWEDIFLSNPNFSVVEYMGKMSEYQRLLKEKQDAADASGLGGGSEGLGVRSDHLYDSAGNPKGWGGGKFSSTEMSTGEPEEVAKTYDQWGNEVDQGNRNWGIAFNKALPNLTKGGLFGIVNSINETINKNKNQTVATSTDDTGTTNTNVIPQLLSTVVPNFQNVWENAMPENTATTTGANLGITPLATAITEGGGGGIIEAMIAAGADRNDPFGDPTGFM